VKHHVWLRIDGLAGTWNFIGQSFRVPGKYLILSGVLNAPPELHLMILYLFLGACSSCNSSTVKFTPRLVVLMVPMRVQTRHPDLLPSTNARRRQLSLLHSSPFPHYLPCSLTLDLTP